MTIAWTDVTLIAPELSTVSTGLQTLVLAYVAESVDPVSFGGPLSAQYTLAQSYLAAHLASSINAGVATGSGPTILETAGGLSAQYQSLTMFNALSGDYATTGYGRMYAALMHISPNARAPLVI